MAFGISCQKCGTRFKLPDELYERRIKGNLVTMRCRKCQADIRLDATDPGTGPRSSAPPQDDDAAVSPARSPLLHLPEITPTMPLPGTVDEALWTVSYADDDDRELTVVEVRDALARGEITPETIVWQEEMPEWLPISEVPELAKLIPARREKRLPQPPARRPLFPTLAPQELSKEASAAARPSPPHGNGKPLLDLTPTPLLAKIEETLAAPSSVAPTPETQSPDAVAAAKAEPQRKPPIPDRGKPRPAVGLAPSPNPQVRAPPAAEDPARPSGVLEDLVAAVVAPEAPAAPLGGMFATAVTEKVEPATDSVAPAPTIETAALEAKGEAPTIEAAPLEAKGEAPTIEAAPIEAKEEAPTIEAAPIEAKEEAPDLEPTALPTSSAEARAPSEEPAAVKAKKKKRIEERSPNAGDIHLGAPKLAKKRDAAPRSERAASMSVRDVPAKRAASPIWYVLMAALVVGGGIYMLRSPKRSPPASEAAAAPTPPEPTAAAAPVAAEAPPFDSAAASAALDAAATSASSCKKDGDPSGTATVVVTFAPSGSVTSATLNGPPFAGTATGSCIESTMRRAKVPAFNGAPMTVNKTVVIE